MTGALDGILVVSLEQAVAAPMVSRRCADAGARVIKLERPEGDFARAYDTFVNGGSAYFYWLNRGKESVVTDLGNPDDRKLFEALLGKADVFVQNLKPGALKKLGYDPAELRRRFPRLICCSISGYGDEGPYASRKAYDLLIQAESGLASVTGGPEEPSRIGVSVVDINTGMFAYEAILEALIRRGRTGEGADLRVSMFDCMAEQMGVPILQTAHGFPPRRIGLAHPSIAPYGVFKTGDGVPILIAIQNEREWKTLCSKVLGNPGIPSDPRFASNAARIVNREATDKLVADWFSNRSADQAAAELQAADIAYGRVSDSASLLKHPHLRLMTTETPTGPAIVPMPPVRREGPAPSGGRVPKLGEHTAKVRSEFL
jgi:formyl-CoA transferase